MARNQVKSGDEGFFKYVKCDAHHIIIAANSPVVIKTLKNILAPRLE